METEELIISDPAGIADGAKELLHRCKNHFFFAFYGDLGAGKTTFIKAICQALGSQDNVSSPTFSLVNEYQTGTSIPIYHMDLYRLNNLEEAQDIGIEEYFYRDNAYCLVEWPALAEPVFPPGAVKIFMTVGNNNERIIRIEK